MWDYLLYAVTILLMALSFVKDRQKTRAAFNKAWKAFLNIMPEFLGIILIVGMVLAILNPEAITGIIGESSGWTGVILTAVVGAITLVPGFIAFPTAAMLLHNGAGYMQIGAFISTLMMVGVVTAPVEIRYFGKRLTIMRNLLAFMFSFLVAYIIGKAVGGN